MQQGRRVWAAQRGAIKRAEYQLLDQPKVLDDPFALRIIGKDMSKGITERIWVS
jgi:hypothetical protein